MLLHSTSCFAGYSFTNAAVSQSCRHVALLVFAILLYDNRLKMGKLTFYKKTLAFCKIPWYYLTCVSGCGSAWLERRLREAEVASSNPATPIHCKVLDFQGLFLLHFMLYHGTFLIFSMFPFGVSL